MSNKASEHIRDIIGDLLGACPICADSLAELLGVKPLVIRNKIFRSDSELEEGEDWYFEGYKTLVTKKGFIRLCMTVNSEITAKIRKWIERRLPKSSLDFLDSLPLAEDTNLLSVEIFKRLNDLDDIRKVSNFNRAIYLKMLE